MAPVFNTILIGLIWSMVSVLVTSMELQHRKAVIVGGGPTGLAAASMLSKIGWRDVTILEKRTVPAADLEKSYLYLLDERGQRLTDFLNLTQAISAVSVSSHKFQNITEVLTTGEARIKSIPVDKKANEKFWLPRSNMLDVFTSHLEDDSNIHTKLYTGASCVNVTTSSNGYLLVDVECIVDTEKEKGDVTNLNTSKMTFEADLIVGCDGIQSSIRRWLVAAKGPDFDFTTLSSDAAGLQFKILSLLPNCALPVVRDNETVMESATERAYAIRGTGKTSQNRLSLGLLPMKQNPDTDKPKGRTANIICKPDHQIWTMRTPAQMRTFLEGSFPQLKPLQNFVSDAELQRFASLSPGTFPPPQHVSALYSLHYGVRGVVLLGDAAHCFPPDLGQGVNSALEDVFELGKCLQASDNRLDTALPMFERKRLPDIKALCRLMQFAYPYQYKQAPIKEKLCLLNFALRLLLSRVAPWLISPPAFFMIQDASMSYKKVLSRAHATTRNLVMLVLLALAVMVPAIQRYVTRTVQAVATASLASRRMLFI